MDNIDRVHIGDVQSSDAFTHKNSASLNQRSNRNDEGENEDDSSSDGDVVSVVVNPNSTLHKRKRPELGNCEWKKKRCGGVNVHGLAGCIQDEVCGEWFCVCDPPPNSNFEHKMAFIQYVLVKRAHLLKPPDGGKGWETFAKFLYTQCPEFMNTSPVKGTTLKGHLERIVDEVVKFHKRKTPFEMAVLAVKKDQDKQADDAYMTSKTSIEVKCSKTFFGNKTAPVITVPARVVHKVTTSNSSSDVMDLCLESNTASQYQSDSSAALYTILPSKHPAQGIGAIGDLEHGIDPPYVIPNKKTRGAAAVFSAAPPSTTSASTTSHSQSVTDGVNSWMQLEKQYMVDAVITENKKLAMEEQRIKNETESLAIKKLEAQNTHDMMQHMMHMMNHGPPTVPTAVVNGVVQQEMHTASATHNEELFPAHDVTDTMGVVRRVYDV